MDYKSFMDKLSEEKTIEVTMKSGHKFTAPIKMTHKDWHIVKHPTSGKQYRVDHKGNTLSEELDESHVEFRLDHRDKVKGDHKPTFKDHEATVSDTTDKATYVKVPAHKATSFKSAMKTKHGVTAELAEEVEQMFGLDEARREDDEYHVPDPTTRTHKIGFHVSKDGAEKHHRTVTLSNSTKSPEEAKATARAHLEKQGYKIHEAVEIEEAASGHTMEAHGVKGMKNTPWRKSFKSHDNAHDWAEKNDAEIHGTRDLEQAKKGNLSPAMKEESENQVHRVGVTVSDRNHPMVSRRKEKVQKFVNVTSNDKDKAISRAVKHLQSKGYTVHDHHYVGLKEAVVGAETRSDFKLDKAGRKSHKQIVFHDGAQNKELDDKLKREEVEIEEAKEFGLPAHAQSHVEKKIKSGEWEATHDIKAGRHLEIIDHSNGGKRKTIHVKEETEMQEEMTDAQKQERERLVKGMKKNIAGFKAKYGDQAKSVMYATATKNAMKEETEEQRKDREEQLKKFAGQVEGNEMCSDELEEAFINGREYASHGLMHPDHAKMGLHQKNGNTIDFYHSKTGDKIPGKVTKNDGKEVHIRATNGEVHKYKVTPHLPKKVEEATDTVTKDKSGKVISFKHEGDWKKTDPKKNPEGKVHNLAGQALQQAKKLNKEEAALDELNKSTIASYAKKSAAELPKHQMNATYKATGPIAAAHAGKHPKTGESPIEWDNRKVKNRGAGITRAVDKLAKEEVELEEGYDKTSDHHKAARSMAREHGGKATFNSDGTAHVRFNDAVTGRSTVNPKGTLLHTGSEAASRAAKDHGKGKVDGSTVHFKEEVETIEEAVESGNKGYGYHGQHPSETADKEYSKAHATVKKVAGAAGHLKDAKKPNVMVKHYLDSKHGRHLADVGTHDHEYIKKDFGTFKKNYKPELHEAANFDEQGNLMAEKLKFSDFIAKMNEQLLEYESDDSGVYRHTKKATYGNSYQGDDDEDEKPKKAAAPAEKRGRGRPAGSTGASYKPRSAATAAAAKAKAAATKAANKNK